MIERCPSYARYHRGQSTEHAGLRAFLRNLQTSPAECFIFLSVDVLFCVSLAVLKVLQHSLKPVNAAEFQVWDCTVIYKVMNPMYHSQQVQIISLEFKYLLFGFSCNWQITLTSLAVTIMS